MTCSACGGVHAGRLGERVSEYVLFSLLGSGGMASVYEARHTGASRGRVAIKIPHPCHRGDSALRTRFSREARASAVIHAEEDQENVINVLADGLADDGTPYVVLRRLFGRTLKQWLGERKQPVDVSRAVDFVLDAGLGLHVAHTRGVIHRDVKPANLFVARTGAGTEYCVLLDFGVAKFMNEEDAVGITGSNGAPGTPGYMPIEQFFGAAAPRSDVYALGSVLYELLANEPFRTGSVSPPARGAELEARWLELGSRRSDVPPSLLDAGERMTLDDADRRFQSAAEAFAALRPHSERHRTTILPEVPASRRTEGSTAPTVRDVPKRRASARWRRRAVAAAATVLGLIAAAALGLAVATPRASGGEPLTEHEVTPAPARWEPQIAPAKEGATEPTPQVEPIERSTSNVATSVSTPDRRFRPKARTSNGTPSQRTPKQARGRATQAPPPQSSAEPLVHPPRTRFLGISDPGLE